MPQAPRKLDQPVSEIYLGERRGERLQRTTLNAVKAMGAIGVLGGEVTWVFSNEGPFRDNGWTGDSSRSH